MRFLTVFGKTLREMRRDLLTLSLTVVFAPFFVFLYWLFTYGGSTTYNVLVINQDRGALLEDGTRLHAGEQVANAIAAVAYADGKPMLKTRLLESRSTAENLLRERAAATFILLPEDFSQALADIRRGERRTSAQIVFGGDLTNPYYMISSILATTAVEKEVVRITAQAPLLQYVEEPLGASAARTEFENYVPGILVFAVIMLVFLAAMTVAREVESGTLRRLQLTPLTSLELLGGISAALVLVGVASVFLTFFTAVALGFHSQGPLWLAILIGAVTSLSIIGVGMLVACFSRTVSQAFVIANFPLGLLMFFSGSIFPIPAVKLFTVAGRAVSLYDALPATHAVAALHKVLTLGAGLPEVAYELTTLCVLSALYFGAGVWLFQRTHMRAE